MLLNLDATDEAEWLRLAAADYSDAVALEGLPLAEAWAVSALHQVYTSAQVLWSMLYILLDGCPCHRLWTR